MGQMGRRMAKRLINAGHELHVWNRSEAALSELIEVGANKLSLDDLGEVSVVISMLRDDKASEEVWNQILAKDQLKGKTCIECSTLSPAQSKSWSEKIQESGAQALCAPVVGTLPHAENGILLALVGGDQETLESNKAVLESTMGKILHLGNAEQAAVSKLAINSWFAIQNAALGEILNWTYKAGLDKEQISGIFEQLPVTSPALQLAIPGIKNNEFPPLFPIHLVAKDLRYAAEQGKSDRAKTPLLDKTAALFTEAEEEWGSENISGIARLYS
jgi:3-hydroxyisobutyrate dehydrogenase